MLSKFFDKAGEGLSEKWVERLFGPAFLFWAGGLLFLIRPSRFATAWNKLAELPLPSQTGLLVISLVVLVGSGALMSYLRGPLLRLLEGYWSWPFDVFGLVAIKFHQWRIEKLKARWSKLALKKRDGPLSMRDTQRLARLEAQRAYVPRDAEDVMPTRLGNILRMAESRPYQRYGLDPVLLWPRLWLLLPKDIQEDLSAARALLDRLLEAWGWGVIFLIWGWANPWALLVAVFWMLLTYTLILQSAQTFADLLLSTFDTQRWRLYEALHWPLPEESGETEISAGEALTRYIQRGMLYSPQTYKQPKE